MKMREYQVRPLERGDFAALMRLEEDAFAGDGESTLGAYYVRLCCEFFRETCFVATRDDEVVGYALSFVQDREGWCTTLAVAPAYRRSRVAWALIASLTEALVPRADSCWFTVRSDNRVARKLHAGLGAREIKVHRDFYGPGDDRIVSRIDRDGLRRAAWRYARLGARLAAPFAAASAEEAA